MKEYTAREIDRLFALLSQYERRCIIHFLQETEGGHASVSDVVSHLQKQDQTPSETDKIEIALHHNHLPKLACIDVIDVDSRSNTVRYNGGELVETILESTPETRIPST